MTSTKITDDGITTDEIHSTYTVLEHLRDEFGDAEATRDKAQLINGVIAMVQEYEDRADWRETLPADAIDEDEYATL